MIPGVPAFVLLSLVAVLLLGLGAGFDVKGLVIVGFIVAFGALAVAAARKARAGRVTPGRCDECGGLISPHAPYCKHCGALRTTSVR